MEYLFLSIKECTSFKVASQRRAFPWIIDVEVGEAFGIPIGPN